MKFALHPGERVIADKGYNDERCAIPIRLTPRGRILAAQIRARHETCNGRFKAWGVLEGRFRHDISKHGICFHSIANVTQLSLQTEPLFFIEY